MNLLFVCSSNVCRSPYCEYMFRRMAEEDPVTAGKIHVSSSAVLNQMKTIDPKTRAALVREGFTEEEADAHHPGVWYRDLPKFREADTIIGMTKAHKWFTPFPYRKKFITLSEAATGEYNSIPDPWLISDMDEYFAKMDIIKGYLEQYFAKVRAELA